MTPFKKSEHLGWNDGLTIRASAALIETLSSGPITYATAKHHLICELQTICCPLLVSMDTALMGCSSTQVKRYTHKTKIHL